ncbi:YhcH/YjgK/YiaL family protein [Verrucomicrobia bacterium]|nr:YhcH/YjgK/YiaL family protein [Verrucomicrobiota bacterium]MDC0324078.1 YhcH/YjgK/YiaL family protein [Verrucomicrobiota bacterium]
MIISNIRIKHHPFVQSGIVSKCLNWVESMSFNCNEERVTLDGESLFLMQQKYTTIAPEQGKFESHRRYVDIQCLLSGRERIDVADAKKLSPKEGWKGDFRFYHPPQNGFSSISLCPLDYCVLFPGEAHRPMISVERPESVKKIVFKVDVNLFMKN